MSKGIIVQNMQAKRAENIGKTWEAAIEAFFNAKMPPLTTLVIMVRELETSHQTKKAWRGLLGGVDKKKR